MARRSDNLPTERKPMTAIFLDFCGAMVQLHLSKDWEIYAASYGWVLPENSTKRKRDSAEWIHEHPTMHRHKIIATYWDVLGAHEQIGMQNSPHKYGNILAKSSLPHTIHKIILLFIQVKYSIGFWEDTSVFLSFEITWDIFPALIVRYHKGSPSFSTWAWPEPILKQ